MPLKQIPHFQAFVPGQFVRVQEQKAVSLGDPVLLQIKTADSRRIEGVRLSDLSKLVLHINSEGEVVTLNFHSRWTMPECATAAEIHHTVEQKQKELDAKVVAATETARDYRLEVADMLAKQQEALAPAVQEEAPSVQPQLAVTAA